MAYIEVDINMSDLETEDLVDEICRRMKLSVLNKKAIDPKQKALVKEKYMALATVLSVNISGITVTTLDDLIKYEHIAKVFEKYTADEIQQILIK